VVRLTRPRQPQKATRDRQETPSRASAAERPSSPLHWNTRYLVSGVVEPRQAAYHVCDTLHTAPGPEETNENKKIMFLCFIDILLRFHFATGVMIRSRTRIADSPVQGPLGESQPAFSQTGIAKRRTGPSRHLLLTALLFRGCCSSVQYSTLLFGNAWNGGNPRWRSDTPGTDLSADFFC
jgi:hypothetical protein